ncbi:Fic/DOC family protein [Hyphomicrobium sp. DY-1]|uniref:Fic/DOC family protein n=1 Tax=Hyphomicrobium sp. DY-1 TaxID=3075650 RepID=UPI0039C240EC
MYDAERDPYCYPGSDVLKNKAGLTTAKALERFETAMTFVRSEEPLPSGRLSVTHYRAIHHHLFQDVYSWAGRYRTIRISKGDSVFCYPENIAAQMTRVFGWLKDGDFLRGRETVNFAKDAAHFLAELNAIHPFREGNGRTQLTFLALLADAAGHALDLAKLDASATLGAMIASFNGDEADLTKIIADLAA